MGCFHLHFTGLQMSIFSEIAQAQELGKALNSPLLWSNRASIAATIIAGVNFVVPVVNALFGAQVDIPPEDLSAIVNAITIVGIYVIDKLHIASNKFAGK